jgi:predicted methyltransferase
MRRLLVLFALLACRTTTAPAAAAAPVPADISPELRAIVDDPARPADERALDPGRRPAELLAFLDLRPGMRVADIGAGFGYTTFLLARAVGPAGRVYAQNPRFPRERFLEPKWTERLATPPFASVTRVDREFDDPLPPDARDLDLVINVLFYHDTFWMNTDRARMNRAIFAALRPGGAYVIVDHSALPGTGGTEGFRLHRVDEAIVRADLEAAGFRLAATAEFLRNPADPRDWNAAPFATAGTPRRGTADRFILKYVKP